MTLKEELGYEMKPEYDFSGGRRRGPEERLRKGLNVAVIEPDLYAHFPSSEAVNEALRLMVRASAKAVKSKAVERAKAS